MPRDNRDDHLSNILDPWPGDQPDDTPEEPGFECEDCQVWCSSEKPCPCCRAAMKEDQLRYGDPD